jgi:hypothetical protein
VRPDGAAAGVDRRRPGPGRDDARDHVVVSRVLAGDIGLSEAVVVARPGDDEVAFERQSREGGRGIREVLAVTQLEAGEARREHALEDRPRKQRATGRVGDDRYATGPDHELDRRHRVGREERHVVLVVRVQDAGERLGAVGDDPAGHERVRDVGTADRRAVGRLCDDVVPVDVEIARDALGHDLRAVEARGADAIGHRPEGVVVRIDEVGQHVDAAPIVLRRQLHPGQERHAERACGLGRFGPPGRRVVVGESRGPQTVAVRGRHDEGGGFGAVGVCGVEVKVTRSLESSIALHPSSVPSARGAASPTWRRRRGGIRRSLRRLA